MLFAVRFCLELARTEESKEQRSEVCRILRICWAIYIKGTTFDLIDSLQCKKSVFRYEVRFNFVGRDQRWKTTEEGHLAKQSVL